MGNIVVASANEALVISGCKGSRILVGNAAWVWMGCESYGRLSLDLITLELVSTHAETVMGVPVSIKGIAQVKVMANQHMTISEAKRKNLSFNTRNKIISQNSNPRIKRSDSLSYKPVVASSSVSNPVSPRTRKSLAEKGVQEPYHFDGLKPPSGVDWEADGGIEMSHMGGQEEEKGRGDEVDDIVETHAIDFEKIKTASQLFLGRSEDAIQETLRMTMEGHQRQIIGTLSVEQLFRDRHAFSHKVKEHVAPDLQGMGFTLVSYTVTKIEDFDGYMEALGTTQTAIVQREADEGRARNENEARKKVAIYHSDADIAEAKSEKESHVARNQQAQAKAESDKDLNIMKADFESQLNRASEEAAAMTRITKAEQEKIIIRTKTQAKTEEALVMVKVSEAEIEKVKLEAEGKSQAQLLRQQNEAKGVEVEASATANQIRSIGVAEASAIESKGLAEAKVMREKAVAYSEYGQAAVVQSIVDRLPEIVESIAKPLSKTEKMIFISSANPQKKAAKAAAAKAKGDGKAFAARPVMFRRKESAPKPSFATKPKKSQPMFGRKQLPKPMFARSPSGNTDQPAGTRLAESASA
jgi:flotillin